MRDRDRWGWSYPPLSVSPSPSPTLPLSGCCGLKARVRAHSSFRRDWRITFSLFPLWGMEQRAEGCVREQMGCILIMERLLLWETEGGEGPRVACIYIRLALKLQRAWSSHGPGWSTHWQSWPTCHNSFHCWQALTGILCDYKTFSGGLELYYFAYNFWIYMHFLQLLSSL